jgi:hypothetical protein
VSTRATPLLSLAKRVSFSIIHVEYKMSQPQRKFNFKFVGGPSRKRRRRAPPAVREAEPLPPQTWATAATTTGMQPVFSIHDESYVNSSPEGSDSCNAPGHDFRNGNTAITTRSRPAFTSNPQVPLASLVPPANEVLESLLEWPTSNLLTATDAVGSAVEFNDPFSLFDASQTFASGAVPRPTLDGFEEYFAEDQGASVIDDVPSEASVNSIEDSLRDIDPELEDHRSVRGNIGDNFSQLFAQCRSQKS